LAVSRRHANARSIPIHFDLTSLARTPLREDLSVFDSRAGQINPTKGMADAALKTKIRVFGIRALMRKTGLSQHTIEKIRDGLPVRRATLRRVIAALQ
jgi:hypothetical protein